MTRVFASPCSHACCNAQTGAFVVKMDGIARSTSDGNYPVSFRGVIDGLQRQGSSNPTGRYEALDASAVRGALSAAEHRGNRLYFCTVAWKLGHDLIGRSTGLQPSASAASGVLPQAWQTVSCSRPPE